MTVAESLARLHHNRYGLAWVAHERDKAFQATTVGAALQRFESAHYEAVRRDEALGYTDGGNERAAKAAWARSDEARAQLETLIVQLLEGRYR